jgi:3-oxoadipate enol-lactonase/4-carboxymuconolactone decarboxylase
MFLETRQLLTHVVAEGPAGAPALLLLHSLGTNLHVWDPQAAALAQSFRVIRPDLRGHGLSQVTAGPYTIEQLANDSLALLDALGVEAAHVGGLSLGGFVAQAVAARAPARVRSLVLCDTALALPPPEGWRARAATVRERGTAAIADEVLARWLTPPNLGSSVARGLRAMLERSPAEGYASSAEAIGGCDFTESSAGLRMPVLVVVGDKDPVAPVAAAERMRDAIPGAELAVVADAAHIATLERPEAVTAAIERFLAPRGERYERGMEVRRHVLGAAHVERATAAATAFDRDFQRFITETAWGSVWARPGLDLRTRSLLTLTLLAALGRDEELAMHVRATRQTGATPSEIAEALLHVAVYAGIPAANHAMSVAKSILQEVNADV